MRSSDVFSGINARAVVRCTTISRVENLRRSRRGEARGEAWGDVEEKGEEPLGEKGEEGKAVTPLGVITMVPGWSLFSMPAILMEFILTDALWTGGQRLILVIFSWFGWSLWFSGVKVSMISSSWNIFVSSSLDNVTRLDFSCVASCSPSSSWDSPVLGVPFCTPPTSSSLLSCIEKN